MQLPHMAFVDNIDVRCLSYQSTTATYTIIATMEPKDEFPFLKFASSDRCTICYLTIPLIDNNMLGKNFLYKVLFKNMC